MLPLPDSWSIVILGSWNPSIFTAEWIARNLSDDKECKVEIAFNLSDPTAPRKISFEGISIFPGRKQLLLSPNHTSIDGMNKCSVILVKILSLLSHTPVGNAGINFSFTNGDKRLDELNNPKTIVDLFTILDSAIARSLSKDGWDYLLKYTTTTNGNGNNITFNFHYEKPDINYYVELFQNDIIDKHYKEALEFSNEHYNLQLEEA